MTRRSRRPLHSPTQSGFSLITTLILLVIATLLGLMSAQIVLMSERSGRYERDQQIAFQAAEAALLDAEFDLHGADSTRKDLFSPTSIVGFEAGCSKGSNTRGLCLPAEAGAAPVWTTVSFTDGSSDARTVALGSFTDRNFTSGLQGAQSARAPRYLIEAIVDPTPGIDKSKPRYLYRVTAVGFGPREDTQVMLQMHFRKE